MSSAGARSGASILSIVVGFASAASLGGFIYVGSLSHTAMRDSPETAALKGDSSQYPRILSPSNIETLMKNGILVIDLNESTISDKDLQMCSEQVAGIQLQPNQNNDITVRSDRTFFLSEHIAGQHSQFGDADVGLMRALRTIRRYIYIHTYTYNKQAYDAHILYAI